MAVVTHINNLAVRWLVASLNILIGSVTFCHFIVVLHCTNVGCTAIVAVDICCYVLAKAGVGG